MKMLLLQQLGETIALLTSGVFGLELASSDGSITYIQAELFMSVSAQMFTEVRFRDTPWHLSNQFLLPSALVSEADQKM